MTVHFSNIKKLTILQINTCNSVVRAVSKRQLMVLLYFIFAHKLYAQHDVQLHTDRTYYFPGDTVWYKANLIYKGSPDTTIRNLAMVIGRPDKDVLEQQLRPVVGGSTFGQYIIPDDYKDHELYFNLYTKRKEHELFVSKIGVFQKKEVVSDSKPAVAVFIEGGGIFSGLSNSATFRWNVRTEINAVLADETGTEVAAFTTDTLGRASVEFRAEKSPLFLRWSHQGTNYEQALSDSPYGARMWLEQADDTTLIIIENPSRFRNATLLFSPEPGTTWHKNLPFGLNNVISFSLEELLGGSYFGDFVLQEQDSVLATMRLDRFNPIQPQLSFEQVSFDRFGENSFDILIPDYNEWNLSVSVHDGLLPSGSNDPARHKFATCDRYRYSYPKPGPADSINDAFLSLKGQIKMPPKEWEKFWGLRHKRQQRLEREDKTVKGASFGYRLLTEADFRYEEVQYDTLGNLLLRDIVFYDTLQTRVVQIDERLKTIAHEIEWSFSNFEPVDRMVVPDFEAGTDLSHVYIGKFDPHYYILPSGERAIKEVGIPRKKVDARIQKMQAQFSRGWFDRESVMDIDLLHEGIPGYVFTLEELTEYLKNKYPIIRGLGPLILANNIHDRDKTWTGGDMPLDVTEIVFARVYEKYIQHPSGGGAIMYYTSGVNARNKDIGVAKISLSNVAGYSGFHDFHHKKYNRDSLPAYDDRQTLYWNPDVQIKGNVKFPVRFHNNTLSDSYIITVQGVSRTGRTIRFSKRVTKADLDTSLLERKK